MSTDFVLDLVTPQGRIDDLTVISFENFQRDPTLVGDSFLSLLEPHTRGVTTHSVTEDPPPVSASHHFLITTAHVPVRLTAPPAPLPLPAVAAAPALVAADTADVEEAEPHAAQRFNFLLTMQILQLLTFCTRMNCHILFQVTVVTAPPIPHVKIWFENLL